MSAALLPRVAQDLSPEMRFSHWLAFTCKLARENAGTAVAAVSAASGKDQSTIHRFEKEATWSRDPDGMLAAYAKTCGIEDARELWQVALNLWRNHGEVPQLSDEDRLVQAPEELERELDEELKAVAG